METRKCSPWDFQMLLDLNPHAMSQQVIIMFGACCNLFEGGKICWPLRLTIVLQVHSPVQQ